MQARFSPSQAALTAVGEGALELRDRCGGERRAAGRGAVALSHGVEIRAGIHVPLVVDPLDQPSLREALRRWWKSKWAFARACQRTCDRSRCCAGTSRGAGTCGSAVQLSLL